MSKNTRHSEITQNAFVMSYCGWLKGLNSSTNTSPYITVLSHLLIIAPYSEGECTAGQGATGWGKVM